MFGGPKCKHMMHTTLLASLVLLWGSERVRAHRGNSARALPLRRARVRAHLPLVARVDCARVLVSNVRVDAFRARPMRGVVHERARAPQGVTPRGARGARGCARLGLLS